MKKRILAIALSFCMCLTFNACDKAGAASTSTPEINVPLDTPGTSTSTATDSTTSISAATASTSTEDTAVSTDDTANTDASSSTDSSSETSASTAKEPLDTTNMYRSELTNEWISKDIENQRPIAVMVDNESKALDHYGLNRADIVYELMNSTANGRITRFMAIVKDWQNLEQFGSVRSARPTNFNIVPEYDAIFCHDGGPFYINVYVAQDFINNLNGGFARFTNGKAWEFTEYITSEAYTNPDTGKAYKGLKKRISDAGYSTEYTSYYPGKHFTFSESELNIDSSRDGYTDCKDIYLPYPHNKSELHYNANTGLYEYSEYGIEHIDPLDNDNILAFKNVILLCADYEVYDENGYMQYNIVNESYPCGYYITNGKAALIGWDKGNPTDLTNMWYLTSNESLVINTGKTYITYVPSDVWFDLSIK